MFINCILYLATMIISSLCEMEKNEISTENQQTPCNEDKFLQVLVHFRVSSPEDLIFLGMQGNKPNFCRDLTVETERIAEYLKHCCPTDDQGLYLRLLSGVSTIKSKLCDDTSFRKLFKRSERCYDVIQYEVMSCIGPEDWIEIKNSTKVCEIMKSVIGCHYTKTLMNCNIFSAEVLNELMKNIMSTVSDVKCKNMVQETYVRDLRSIMEASTTKLMPSILTVASLIYFLL